MLMAKPRPEKKRDPAASGTTKVLPMQLRVGDRIADELGEWEFCGPMYTGNFGKAVHAGFRLVEQPSVVELRMWGAHERVSVKRI